MTKKELEEQVKSLTDALQRERADAENIRKRSAQEVVDAIVRGQEIAVEELLPLIDNLERAFAHVPSKLKDDKWVKGIMGLEKQLFKLMQEFGLEKIQTTGEVFDPETMQAVSVEEGKGKSQLVIEEVQSGYKLNGRILRVAMVKVRS